MEPLPLEYKKYGFLFKQIKRVENVAIYSQSDVETGQFHGYEVFIIQEQPATEIYGRFYEAKENVPGSSQWGQLGFTVGKMERALLKMEELLKKEHNRKKN